MKLIKISKKFIKGIREELMRKHQNYQQINKRGYELMLDPTLNKTCAYSDYERDNL